MTKYRGQGVVWSNLLYDIGLNNWTEYYSKNIVKVCATQRPDHAGIADMTNNEYW